MDIDKSFTALFLPVGEDARMVRLNDINEVDSLISDWEEFYPFDGIDIALLCSSSVDALSANRTIIGSDGIPVMIYGDFLLVNAPVWADRYFDYPNDDVFMDLERQLKLPDSCVSFPSG